MEPSFPGRFDAMADDYDQSRPGYPDELVRGLGPPCDVVEVAQRRYPQARFVLGRFRRR